MKAKLYIASLVALGLLLNTGCKEKEVVNEQLTLTTQEQQDLQFLIEEEKLARDVYLYANELYNEQIFSNISGSEQTHMNKVAELLDKYGLSYELSEERGIFYDIELQQLYTDLVATCDKGLVDALTVGATIENLDINDIILNEANTTNADLLVVYDNLKCGSRNHIRAYASSLEKQGESYTPQFISEELYASILEAGHENCGH
jgi:hypothetical protein